MFLAIRARINALRCILKGHDVKWRIYVDEVCYGDIVCKTCSNGCLFHWCRGHEWFGKIW
jgi:hypothetical protein